MGLPVSYCRGPGAQRMRPKRTKAGARVKSPHLPRLCSVWDPEAPPVFARRMTTGAPPHHPPAAAAWPLRTMAVPMARVVARCYGCSRWEV